MERRGHAIWSVNLGIWSGVSVRVHVLYLLFVIATLYVASLAPTGPEKTSVNRGILSAGLAILVVSTVLHEVGHACIAFRMRGTVDEVILTPWGGFESHRIPGEPQAEVLVHLAGPAIHAALAGMVAFPILFAQDGVKIGGLLYPFSPVELTVGDSWWLLGAKLVFWINCVLLYVNLIPAFPFDGGRILRSALVTYWPGLGSRSATVAVAWFAKVLAVILSAAALLSRNQPSTGLIPMWLGLALLAVFIWFSARHEEFRLEDPSDEESPFGYDFSQGYTSLERTAERTTGQLGPFRRWLEQRREARETRRQEVEAEEERRVDEILVRLHAVGLDNLTPEERALLQRVSARYRDRHGHQA